MNVMSGIEKLLVVTFSGALVLIGLKPLKHDFSKYTNKISSFWSSITHENKKDAKELDLGSFFSNLKGKIDNTLENEKVSENYKNPAKIENSDNNIKKEPILNKKMDKMTNKDRKELDSLVNGL